MSVRIVHASIDENKNAKNGLYGDQTGTEVCIRDWYYKNWDYVLRPKSTVIADKSVSSALKLANSPLVGYDQNERNTLHTKLKSLNYDVDTYINSGLFSETDCSAFMTLVSIIGGASKLEYSGNAPTTSNMDKKFIGTGLYTILTDSKYLTTPDYLKKGDILVQRGHHTVMVVNSGSKADIDNTQASVSKEYDSAESKDSGIKGYYLVSASKLNVRKGAGKNKDVITVLVKDQRVVCFGYYNIDESDNDKKWFLIQCKVDGVKYTGYVSSEYLIKCLEVS